MIRMLFALFFLACPLFAELYSVESICPRAGMQCYILMSNGVEKWRNQSRNTEYLLGLHHVYHQTWLVVVRISKNVGRARGVVINANGGTLFGCETEDGVKINILNNDRLTTELFNSYLRHSFFYCEFTVSANEEHEFIEYFEDGDLEITVKQSGINYPTARKSSDLYQEVTNKGAETICDIEILKYASFSDVAGESSMRPIIFQKRTVCPMENMQQIYKIEGKYKSIEDISCDYVGLFHVPGEHFDSRRPVNAACSRKTCTMCTEVDGLNGLAAPEYTPPDMYNCARLKCPENTPAIVPARHNATFGTPVCKKFDEGDFRWSIPSPGGRGDVFFTEATCVQIVACHDVHPLSIICDSAESCARINPWSQKVTCSDNYILVARTSKDADWEILRRIECDVTKGTWTKIDDNHDEFPLEADEDIKCFRTRELQDDTTTTALVTSTTEPSTTTTTTELRTTTTEPPVTITNVTTPEPTTTPLTKDPTSMATEQSTSTEMSPEEQNNSNAIVAIIVGVNIMVLIFSISTCYLIKRRVKTKKARAAKKSTDKKDASKLPSAPLAYASKMTSVTSSQTQTPPLPPTSNESEKKPEKQEKQEKQEKIVVEKKQDSQEVIVDPSKDKISAEVVEKDGSFKKTASAPAAPQVEVQQPVVDNEDKEDAEQKKNKVQEMLERSVVSEKTE